MMVLMNLSTFLYSFFTSSSEATFAPEIKNIMAKTISHMKRNMMNDFMSKKTYLRRIAIIPKSSLNLRKWKILVNELSRSTVLKKTQTKLRVTDLSVPTFGRVESVGYNSLNRKYT